MNVGLLRFYGYKLMYKIKFYEFRACIFKLINTFLKSKKIKKQLDRMDYDRSIAEIAQRYTNKLDFTKYLEIQKKSQGEVKKIIWQCWLQGEENTSNTIKKCFETVKKFQGDYERIVLTEENIKKYVDIPDFIWEKYKKGLIKHAHFSDLLRVYLLAQRGGVWMDASVYLNTQVPQDILNAGFFVFKRPKIKPNARIFGNWFIVAKANNSLICMIRDLLTDFWRENDNIIDYFMMHHLFTSAVHGNKLIEKEFAKMPFYSNRLPHLFDRLIHKNKGYTDSELKKYYYKSFIHKISHRHENTEELLKRLDEMELN